jgi:O-antigen ligase
MKNPAFWIVCFLVAVTPLLRGSVHAWATTLIQILVTAGLMVLVAEQWRRLGPEKAESQAGAGRKTRESGKIRESRRISSRGLPGGRVFWIVVLPCILLGVWATVFSPHPALALDGMLMLLTYLGFFYLVFQSVRNRREQRFLLWVVVWTAVGLGVIALLQRFGILVFSWWDYSEELGRNVYGISLTGPYVNRNHLAGFLEMAIAVLLGLLLIRSRSPEVRIGMVGLVLFLIICQAMTLSRGGWAGAVGVLVFMLVVLLFKKGFQHKRMLIYIFLGVVITGVVILASTPVVDRINTLIEQDIDDNLASRYRIWAGAWDLFKDNMTAGTGPGTFRVAFPPYQVPGDAYLARYAHNDILQFAADTGILFFPLMLWLLFLFFKTGFAKFQSRSRQTSGIALGCMAAAIAILIHSYSDGNLQIPANALLFTTLSALVLKPE